MLAFFIVAAPWIGVLSWKYGRPTFSTVARVSHAIIGPADKVRDHAWYRQLFQIPPGRISICETPEAMPYNDWSPLENKDYLLHQVRYSIKTAESVVASVASYDMLRITLPALVLLPVVMSGAAWRVRRRKAAWVLATVAIYACGFALVCWQDRYTHPFLFPLCCIYCTAFCTSWFRPIAARLGLARSSQYLASGLVALSFAAMVASWSIEYAREAPAGQTPYRRWAEEMKAAGCQGPLASWPREYADCGLFVAYHMGEPYAGCPEGRDAAQIESALNAFGVQTLLLAPDKARAGEFIEHTSWRKRLVLPGEDGTELRVYVRGGAEAD
jgi:hypothetical protein